MRDNDLTVGNIPNKIFFLSMPIMGVMFMHCAFNIIDMFWLGKLGSESVAAVGSAGFYPWLANGIILLARVGGDVRISQSIGEKNVEKTKKYVKSVLELNIIHGLIFTIIVVLFSRNLMEVLNIKNEFVNSQGALYLRTYGFAMIPFFMIPIFNSVFNSMGNSKLPFKINCIGILINIILDPILIFGWFGMPKLGVFGAGLATSISIIVEASIFVIVILYSKIEYFKVHLFRKLNLDAYKDIYKLGLPVSLQSCLFTFISMGVAIIVARFGPAAIAGHEIGVQIESISFMAAEGISSAMVAFVGQNIGAKNAERVLKGIKIGISFAIFWGFLTLFIMVFLGKSIFTIFLNDPMAVSIGTAYLIIFGLNQPFNTSEIICNGIFKGVGRTLYPSVVNTTCNLLRIPMSLWFVHMNWGVNGIWIALSITSVMKGASMLAALYIHCKRKTLYPGEEISI